MNFSPYRDSWPEDDHHANFKAEVASYSVVDPMPTLENLSQATGIPTSCLVRYVLVKWAASGTETVLEMSPIVLRQMQQHIDRAESTGTRDARLDAYESLRQMVAWLCLALEQNEVESKNVLESSRD